MFESQHGHIWRFVLRFVSLPLEVTRPNLPTLCTKVAVKHQSSSSFSSKDLFWLASLYLPHVTHFGVLLSSYDWLIDISIVLNIVIFRQRSAPWAQTSFELFIMEVLMWQFWLGCNQGFSLQNPVSQPDPLTHRLPYFLSQFPIDSWTYLPCTVTETYLALKSFYLGGLLLTRGVSSKMILCELLLIAHDNIKTNILCASAILFTISSGSVFVLSWNL